MSPDTAQSLLEELPRMEQLINKDGLRELISSLSMMSGVSIRLLNNEGVLLVDHAPDLPLLRYLDGFPAGRTALGRDVARIRQIYPRSSSETCESFTGAKYRIVGIEYDHRRIGRAILGPFVSTQVGPSTEVLRALDPQIDPEIFAKYFTSLPLLPEDRLEQLERHLRSCLDLILFAGHKSLLTTKMHLASTSESYRELQDRNTKLQLAYDRLRELDRLKSNFLATVSHELRTPLTSIIGYSEMLTEGIAGQLEGEQLEFVQTIHEKGEQLLQLIKDLLDLSKLESGTLTIKRTPIPIEPVLRQVVSTLLPLARKKGVVLEVECAQNLPEILGDSERLRQVFLNLTENALKFTPVSGLIRLSAAAVAGEEDDEDGFVLMASTPEQIEIRVADTGIGIPEKEREKVFDAFYQVDSSSTREVGGTGLGLSIVRRILDAHEGKIHIEGNQPRGTVIVVRIPAVLP